MIIFISWYFEAHNPVEYWATRTCYVATTNATAVPLFYRLLPPNKTLFSLPSIYLGFAPVFFNNTTFMVAMFRVVSPMSILAPGFCISPYIPKMRLSQYADMELFFLCNSIS